MKDPRRRRTDSSPEPRVKKLAPRCVGRLFRAFRSQRAVFIGFPPPLRAFTCRRARSASRSSAPYFGRRSEGDGGAAGGAGAGGGGGASGLLSAGRADVGRASPNLNRPPRHLLRCAARPSTKRKPTGPDGAVTRGGAARGGARSGVWRRRRRRRRRLLQGGEDPKFFLLELRSEKQRADPPLQPRTAPHRRTRAAGPVPRTDVQEEDHGLKARGSAADFFSFLF